MRTQAPNGLQNWPVLSFASGTPTSTVVNGTLNSQANTTYTLEFFASGTVDLNGLAQGALFLQSQTVTANANGNAPFNFTLRTRPTTLISSPATATDPNDNTSEFPERGRINPSATVTRGRLSMTVKRQRNTPGTFAVLANDTDPPDSDVLTITAVSTPTSGTAVISGSDVLYTPAADFNGSDSFTYTISDGHNHTDTATVSVTVNSVNDAPSFTKGAASKTLSANSAGADDLELGNEYLGRADE